MGRRVSFDSSNIKDFPQHGVTVQRKPDRLYVMCRKFYLDAQGQRHEYRVYVGHVNQDAFYTSEEAYKRRVMAQQAQAGITLSPHQIDFEPGIEKLSLHQVHLLQQFYQLNPEFVAKSPITVLALARRLQELATNAEHKLWQDALESLSLDKLPTPGALPVPSKETRPRKNAVPSAEDILLEAQIDIFNFTTSVEFKSWLTLTPFEPQNIVFKGRAKSVPRPGATQPVKPATAPAEQPTEASAQPAEPRVQSAEARAQPAEASAQPAEASALPDHTPTKAVLQSQFAATAPQAQGPEAELRSSAEQGAGGNVSTAASAQAQRSAPQPQEEQAQFECRAKGAGRSAQARAVVDGAPSDRAPAYASAGVPQAPASVAEPEDQSVPQPGAQDEAGAKVRASRAAHATDQADAAAQCFGAAAYSAGARAGQDAYASAGHDAYATAGQAARAAAATAHKSVSLGAELQVDTGSELHNIAQHGARALAAEGPLTLGMWLNRPHPNGALVALDEHSPAYYMARYRVYEADCNRWGFLTEPSLFAYCQHARLDFFLEQLSFDLESYLIGQKLHLVQIESQERYFAPITLGTQIVVSVVPLKVQRSAICYYQEIRDRAGILRFAQKSRHACCEQVHGRQVSIPEPIVTAVIPYVPLTPVPEAI